MSRVMKNMKGLHHIELYVSDLGSSTQFWGWLLEELGYKPYQEWDQGKSWKYGDAYIVFVQTDKKYIGVPYHRKRVGLNHLAFHVESPEQLEKFRSMLQQQEVQLLYKNKKIGQNRIFFEDPDRIKVELVVWNT